MAEDILDRLERCLEVGLVWTGPEKRALIAVARAARATLAASVEERPSHNDRPVCRICYVETASDGSGIHHTWPFGTDIGDDTQCPIPALTEALYALVGAS